MLACTRHLLSIDSIMVHPIHCELCSGVQYYQRLTTTLDYELITTTIRLESGEECLIMGTYYHHHQNINDNRNNKTNVHAHKHGNLN